MTVGNTGKVMASINNLVLALIRQAGFHNASQARRWFAAHLSKTFTFLNMPFQQRPTLLIVFVKRIIVEAKGEIMDYGLNSRFVSLRGFLQDLSPRNEEGGSAHVPLRQIWDKLAELAQLSCVHEYDKRNSALVLSLYICPA